MLKQQTKTIILRDFDFSANTILNFNEDLLELYGFNLDKSLLKPILF